jgi:2-(1,2-epoxy-1,2-dihydrophenyl)acetyl-CoA isomerase
MNEDKVLLRIEDNVAVVTLNAPEVLNALSAEMVRQLSVAVSKASKTEGVRCLLLNAAGRGFCAGANLQARGDATDLPPAGSALETHYAPLMNKLRNLSFPIVTAVNGPAAGVGMSLALTGDIVMASETAYFLQAFAKIGLVPDGGATWYLPRLIGWGRAMELSMLAERLPASEARSWGLVNRVVPEAELEAASMAMAQRLASGPKSLGLIRKAYWASWENDFNKQMQLEADLQTEAHASVDNREGVAAFLEKRPAVFTGQ